ncbi:MAG: CRISPR-associated protein Cas4 [Candidatus Poribacteria bacterium]|nr:CRISPR-associated protein Cas4 [Candidatus Poribacteria bacterium]
MNIRVSDIKQYFYCPRVVYHTYFTPVHRPVTHPMQHGAVEHEVLSVLERRRLLSRYGLESGNRKFHVALNADALGLSGVLDLLIETEEGAFPVEFKSTRQRLNLNAKYQLTAYAMMVEECLGQTVSQGFIYRIPTRRITAVPITEALRRKTLDSIDEIRTILSYERMPPPTPQRGKCVECEFRRFCADVL